MFERFQAATALGLGALGLLGLLIAFAKSKLIPYLKSFWTRPRVIDPLAEFGSDDLPPPRTTLFNEAIVKACGESLTAEQKLEMLLVPGITKATALERARGILELSLKSQAKS
mgnify:CR=1 FL=1